MKSQEEVKIKSKIRQALIDNTSDVQQVLTFINEEEPWVRAGLRNRKHAIVLRRLRIESMAIGRVLVRINQEVI